MKGLLRLSASLLSAGLLLAGSATAQTKLGTNPTTINPSAVLELESTTRGFLPPRVTQAQMNAIATPATWLTVACTDCTPAGLRAYDGTAWVLVGANSANATFTSGTLSCSGALTGTYQQGVATTSSNTKAVTLTANTTGQYTATTNTVNGVTFAASGTLSSTGANTQIVLTASGTPTASGSFSYVANVDGQTCTFSVTYTIGATVDCGSATQTLSPASGLVNGTSYSGTYTLPYTAGSGAAYAATTLNQNGLTLTRTAGTFIAGGGNIVYTLSGTYTGTSGAVTFSVPEGCTVLYGDAIREALASVGCVSCTAYDAAAVNAWVQVTATEYAAVSNNVLNASKAGISNAGMALTTLGAFGGPNFTVSTSNTGAYPHTPIPSSNYIIGFTMKYTGNSLNGAPTNVAGQQVKWGTSLTSGFTTYGGSFPSINISSNMQLYFINKRPTTITSSSVTYLGTYSPADPGHVSASNTTVYFNSGSNASTLPSNTTSFSIQCQAIVTGNKSW